MERALAKVRRWSQAERGEWWPARLDWDRRKDSMDRQAARDEDGGGARLPVRESPRLVCAQQLDEDPEGAQLHLLLVGG